MNHYSLRRTNVFFKQALILNVSFLCQTVQKDLSLSLCSQIIINFSSIIQNYKYLFPSYSIYSLIKEMIRIILLNKVYKTELLFCLILISFIITKLLHDVYTCKTSDWCLYNGWLYIIVLRRLW